MKITRLFNTKFKARFKTFDMGVKYTFSALLVLVLILTIIILIFAPRQEKLDLINSRPIWYGESWYYCDEEGNITDDEAIDIKHNGRLELDDESDYVYITKTIDTNSLLDEKFMFRTRANGLKVYLNDEVIYSKDYSEEYIRYPKRMYVFHIVDAGEFREGDVLRIEFAKSFDGRLALQYIALGNKYELVLYVMESCVGTLIVLLLSIILMIANLFVSNAKSYVTVTSRVRNLKQLNVFLAMGVLYITSDCGGFDILIGNIYITNWLVCVSLMMLPTPFLLYIKATFFPGHERYNVLASINIAISLVSILAYVVAGYYIANSFWTIYVIVAVAFGMFIDSFYQERDKPDTEVIVGMAAIVATSVLSIVFYLRGTAIPVATIYGYGMLAFCFCMFLWTLRTTGEVRKAREAAELAFARRDVHDAEEASLQKTRFLSHISHEIRTPLNAVLGMNELIMRHTKDELILGYAKNIQSSGRTLLALINDILDFSKIETGKMEVVNTDYSLSSIVYDVILMVRERVEAKGLDFRIDVDKNIPDVLYGDEIRIKQIATNILTNAVKYTKEGWVEFKVTSKEGTLDGMIDLVIRVSDSGIGIKKENLPRIFSEFERFDKLANRTIEGTGLGLSITSKLLELMDGDIKVESEYGNGSTFIVTIPQLVVSDEPIGDYRQRYEAMNNQTSGKTESEMEYYPGRNVFVVDDNDTNLEVISSILEMFEIKVTRSNNPVNALNILKKKRFDMILTDDMMPEINGTELMQEVKNNEGENRYTPVIVLTANAVVGAREDYIRRGFDDYMSKPIDIDVLTRILKKYLQD